jgi:circadian clock protein KaiA
MLPDSLPTPPLFVCAFTSNDRVADHLTQQLQGDHYKFLLSRSLSDFLATVKRDRGSIDCLILLDDAMLPTIVEWLHEHATLLPTVILQAEAHPVDPHRPAPEQALDFLYHTAEVRLLISEMEKLEATIDAAIAEFLQLSLAAVPPDPLEVTPVDAAELSRQNFVLLQQRRLTDKLNERLGYLGVYYKRHPSNFLRAMLPEESQTFLNELKDLYREIILGYFTEDDRINSKIDTFVDSAFFADLSVAQVVEIHMDLIGEFSKQLKLEGRSEDILTDYRLTLIDTLAHLCEMYRRSIPRELPDPDNPTL